MLNTLLAGESDNIRDSGIGDKTDMTDTSVKSPIIVIKDANGTYREWGTEPRNFTWIRTNYEKGACPDASTCSDETCEMGHSDCTVCYGDIYDEGHFLLTYDNKTSAHISCVKVVTT